MIRESVKSAGERFSKTHCPPANGRHDGKQRFTDVSNTRTKIVAFGTPSHRSIPISNPNKRLIVSVGRCDARLHKY